jgi:hypothetical protein
MAPDPAITGSSGGGARGSGGNGESVGLPVAVHASGNWIRLWLLFFLCTVIVGMRPTYRHMMAGPTSQKIRVAPDQGARDQGRETRTRFDWVRG